MRRNVENVENIRTLSRRDYGTQPGVLTPGYYPKRTPPQRGGRGSLATGASMNQARNRFLPPLQGGRLFDRYLGLKPQAESYSPVGTRITFHQSPFTSHLSPGYVVPTFI
jgi:hypothetical protein